MPQKVIFGHRKKTQLRTFTSLPKTNNRTNLSWSQILHASTRFIFELAIMFRETNDNNKQR